MDPRWTNRIQRACNREAGGDTDAADAAAAFLITAVDAGLVRPEEIPPDGPALAINAGSALERAQMVKLGIALDKGLRKLQPARDVALSMVG